MNAEQIATEAERPIDESEQPNAHARQLEAGDMPVEIARKVAKARLAIERVPKSGRNEDQGYDFATADDIIEVCKEALAELDVVVISRPVDADEFPWPWGDSWRLLKLTMEHRVVDAESGAQYIAEWDAESVDNADKLFYKAYTMCKKYFYRDLLDVPTGEGDVERDQKVDHAAKHHTPARQTRSRQPAGRNDELAGINHGGARRQSDPADQERRTELEQNIETLLDDCDIDDAGKKAPVKEWVVHRTTDADTWSQIPTQNLENLHNAIAEYPATGGRLSMRRLWLDRRCAAAGITCTTGTDWTATHGGDDWQAVNKRWRVLTDQAADGDDTKARYHEALKSRHNVSSYNELTVAQIVEDIHRLETRSPARPDDPAEINDRLDYMMSEISERIPSSEELEFDGDDGDEPDIDLDALADVDYQAPLIETLRQELDPVEVAEMLRMLAQKTPGAGSRDDVSSMPDSYWQNWHDHLIDVPDYHRTSYLRRVLQHGKIVYRPDRELLKLKEEDDDLARAVTLARQAVDDELVIRLLDEMCSRTGADTYHELRRADLADWLNWLDVAVKQREYDIKDLVDPDAEANEPEPVVYWKYDNLPSEAHRDLYNLVDSLVDAGTRDRYLSDVPLRGMQADTFLDVPSEHVGKLFKRLMRKSGDAGGAEYIRSRINE